MGLREAVGCEDKMKKITKVDKRVDEEQWRGRKNLL